MNLSIVEVLEFYDVPQVFVALDAIGTSYLCLTYDVLSDGTILCIAVSISKSRLNDFYTGHLDLRQVYLNPEMNLFDVRMSGDSIKATIRHEVLSEAMLPSPGYFLNFSQRENHEMISTSRSEGRTVIRLAFNHETNIHVLSTELLSNTIRNFQAIVSKACKKIYKNQEGNDANLLVRAAIPASFDIEFISEESSNLFGRSKVSDTLEMIKPLFSGNDDEVAACLVNFKATQSNYKALVKDLAESHSSFKVKWVDSSAESAVTECPITSGRIHDLYNLASTLVELEDSTIEYEGRFFMANTKNGTWGFVPEVDSKQKKGVCFERAMLNGIILNDQRYKVTCMVRPSRNPNTGREYRSYVLTDVERILSV